MSQLVCVCVCVCIGFFFGSVDIEGSALHVGSMGSFFSFRLGAITLAVVKTYELYCGCVNFFMEKSLDGCNSKTEKPLASTWKSD